MSRTEDALIKQYGVLIPFNKCASLLDRSSAGLRVSLCNNNELSQKLNKAKVKIGRRVLFRTLEIAKFIDEA